MPGELKPIEPIPLMAGHLEQPDSPILYMSLLFHPERGNVNGEAVITQVTTASGRRLVVNYLRGKVYRLGSDRATRAISLQGEFTQELPPPAFGTITERFSATFVTDSRWKGHGSYEFGGAQVENVPIGPYA